MFYKIDAPKTFARFTGELLPRSNFNVYKYRASKIRCALVLNGIKVRVFFGKNIEKKHLCRQEKNYYYFCKANIPVIKLTVGSRNMIKLSKNMSL